MREAQKNGQSSSRCGSVTLAFCRRTVAAFITLTPLRYACPYSKKKHAASQGSALHPPKKLAQKSFLGIFKNFQAKTRQRLLCRVRFYSSIASKLSLARKMSDMHQIPAKATTVYIMRAASVSTPPVIQATISNLKRPMLPQLSAPMMVMMSAILSIIIVRSSFNGFTVNNSVRGNPSLMIRNFLNYCKFNQTSNCLIALMALPPSYSLTSPSAKNPPLPESRTRSPTA